MSTDTKYNGWTNYETWNAALWLGNDQGSSSLCDELAQEAFVNAEATTTFTRQENATFALSEQLRALFEDDSQLPRTGWMADAINTYLSEVNWHEIAAHYIDDLT